MKNILTYLFGGVRREKPKVQKDGACARCSKPIPPYSTCCIIGYDSRKDGHPRDECNHIICFQCINTLGFECNAVHVSNNNSIPALFFDKKTIDAIHRHEKEIHHVSRNKKRQGKWKTRKRRR